MQKQQNGTNYWFEVDDRQADKVFLVRKSEAGDSTIMPMRRTGPATWGVACDDSVGICSFGYMTAEGQTMFNCGSRGLRIRPLPTPDAA